VKKRSPSGLPFFLAWKVPTGIRHKNYGAKTFTSLSTTMGKPLAALGISFDKGRSVMVSLKWSLGRYLTFTHPAPFTPNLSEAKIIPWQKN
jgi:hypothetical protein